MREEFRVKVLFRRYDVELLGSREGVSAALEHMTSLLE